MLLRSLFCVSCPAVERQEATLPHTVLGVTGINDPRVPSWMIAEFVARLQRATSSGKPVLLRVDFDAGHGLGSNRTQLEQAAADQLSFLLWQMGDREFNTSTLGHNAEAH